MENTVARRRQLLQSRIKQLGGRLDISLPDPGECLHCKAEAVITLHTVLAGMVDELADKRFGQVIRICQIGVEACPGERHAQGDGVTELARLGQRHLIKSPRMICRAAQPRHT